ncbi:hypothetical protein [Salibacterium lacus]|uniref:Uncharacterized protein n=1 Tax=Salibacterium lacus TaxID=1898109 RepID=A0ABW5SXK8_9BACI
MTPLEQIQRQAEDIDTYRTLLHDILAWMKTMPSPPPVLYMRIRNELEDDT